MKIKIGSRGSPLAVIQAEWVAAQLKIHHARLDIEFVRITTTGDRDQRSSLSAIGGKGVFVKEIEEALIENKIDFAVHSLKDVPQTLPYGLELGPFPQREDSRDALLSKDGKSLESLAPGSTIGTSSPRRRAQILYRFKDKHFSIVELRGNIDTRLRKLEEGQYQAIVVAVAGLKRLGLDQKYPLQLLEPEVMMPAPGQGCLAVEHRTDDEKTKMILEPLRNPEADRFARAERAFLQALGGDCLVPVGAYVDQVGEELRMRAILLDSDGKKVVFAEEKGDPNNPDLVGAKCAGRLLYEGGAGLL